jgi:hypothetical protein
MAAHNEVKNLQDLGNLGLGKVLEVMCDNNDHSIVLKVLQTLSTIRRAGYMTIEELVCCLTYCCDRFAAINNLEFFDEFAEYMPDITRQNIQNPFSLRSKAHYFSAKNGNVILNNLQDICTNLDVDELKSWFRIYLVDKKIYLDDQLKPLLDTARMKGPELSNDYFKTICTKYTVPIIMRAGRV